jgi:hypothetical protein
MHWVPPMRINNLLNMIVDMVLPLLERCKLLLVYKCRGLTYQ